MPVPYDVINSPEANADLTMLHAYIANDSAAYAAKMVHRLQAAIDNLRRFPHRTRFQVSSRRINNPVRTLPVRAIRHLLPGFRG